MSRYGTAALVEQFEGTVGSYTALADAIERVEKEAYAAGAEKQREVLENKQVALEKQLRVRAEDTLSRVARLPAAWRKTAMMMQSNDLYEAAVELQYALEPRPETLADAAARVGEPPDNVMAVGHYKAEAGDE